MALHPKSKRVIAGVSRKSPKRVVSRNTNIYTLSQGQSSLQAGWPGDVSSKSSIVQNNKRETVDYRLVLRVPRKALRIEDSVMDTDNAIALRAAFDAAASEALQQYAHSKGLLPDAAEVEVKASAPPPTPSADPLTPSESWMGRVVAITDALDRSIMGIVHEINYVNRFFVIMLPTGDEFSLLNYSFEQVQGLVTRARELEMLRLYYMYSEGLEANEG